MKYKDVKDALEKSIEKLKELGIAMPYEIVCHPDDADEIKKYAKDRKIIMSYLVPRGMFYVHNPYASGITMKEEEHVIGD